MWKNADSLEVVGKGEVAAPENWEVLNPCSVEMSPRALVSLSRTVVMVVFPSNDFCRDERLLFLLIHFEPDSAAFACISAT